MSNILTNLAKAAEVDAFIKAATLKVKRGEKRSLYNRIYRSRLHLDAARRFRDNARAGFPAGNVVDAVATAQHHLKKLGIVASAMLEATSRAQHVDSKQRYKADADDAALIFEDITALSQRWHNRAVEHLVGETLAQLAGTEEPNATEAVDPNSEVEAAETAPVS